MEQQGSRNHTSGFHCRAFPRDAGQNITAGISWHEGATMPPPMGKFQRDKPPDVIKEEPGWSREGGRSQRSAGSSSAVKPARPWKAPTPGQRWLVRMSRFKLTPAQCQAWLSSLSSEQGALPDKAGFTCGTAGAAGRGSHSEVLSNLDKAQAT